MGKKKIIIDTNNLIAALGWKGNSRELVKKVIDKKYEFYMSLKQVAELKRVMDYPKFQFTESQKKRFLEIISEIAIIIDTTIALDITPDPDDNMLLECALEIKAEYIISGDEHLKKLKEFKGIRIIAVKDFLEKEKIFV